MIGFWQSKGLLIACLFVLLGAGCADVAQESQAPAEASTVVDFAPQSVPLQGGEFAHVRQDRVIIVHAPTQETVATVIAKQPRSLQWSTREQALYWIEGATLHNAPENDEHTVIRKLDTQTGAVDSLYWSRGQMTDLFVSEATNILAFTREDTLYTLEPTTGAIHRVASFVEDAEWSPTDTALLVSQRKAAEYITVDKAGVVTTRTPLVQGKRFSGVTFVNGKTALGLQWNDNNVVLRSIDLQSSEGQIIGEWSDDTTSGANDRYEIAVGPEGGGVMVYQSFAEQSGGTLWQWNPEAGERQRLTQADHMLGWTDKKTIWYTTKDDETTRLYSYDVDSGITSERMQRVDDPILIEYTAG